MSETYAVDHLYVVGENETSAVVKIGRSGSPASRLSGIQTGHPQKLHLLHVEDGAGPLEGDVHKLLDSFRVMGEWFDFGDEPALPKARQAINALKAIKEIASSNHVLFSLTAPRRLAAITEMPAESVRPEFARPVEDRPMPPLKPQDPCEAPAVKQVLDSAVRGFFASHPDPTAYLLGDGVAAHHAEWFYREYPEYGMTPDSDLEAAAQNERADPSLVQRRPHGVLMCKLPDVELAAG